MAMAMAIAVAMARATATATATAMAMEIFFVNAISQYQSANAKQHQQWQNGIDNGNIIN